MGISGRPLRQNQLDFLFGIPRSAMRVSQVTRDRWRRRLFLHPRQQSACPWAVRSIPLSYTSPAPVTTSLISYKDVLYFGASEHLHGVNPSNGTVISQLKRDATTEGAFAWASGGDSELEYVFAIRDENGNKMGMLLAFRRVREIDVDTDIATRMVVRKASRLERSHHRGNCGGELVAYRAADGAPQWRDSLKGCIRSIAHDNGLLYIGTQEGTIYAYAPPVP